MTQIRINKANPNNQITPAKIEDETLGNKFKKAFISSTAKEVGEWIFREAFIPWLQDTVVGAVEMAIYGATSRRSSRSRRSSLERENTSYRAFYQSETDRPAWSTDRRNRSYYESERRMPDRIGYNTKIDYRNLIVEIDDPTDQRSREKARLKAIEICDYLYDRIESQYHRAEKADLFEKFNEVTGSDIPINRRDRVYGWTNPNDIGFSKAYEGGMLIGYLIDVAEAKELSI